jgi:hypothetical protein
MFKKIWAITLILFATNAYSEHINNAPVLANIVSQNKNIYKTLGIVENFCSSVNKANAANCIAFYMLKHGNKSYIQDYINSIKLKSLNDVATNPTDILGLKVRVMGVVTKCVFDVNNIYAFNVKSINGENITVYTKHPYNDFDSIAIDAIVTGTHNFTTGSINHYGITVFELSE